MNSGVMSSEARVTYNCEKGELYFASTHRHAYGHDVKVVSAVVILFHSTCTNEPRTSKLRQVVDAESHGRHSLEGIQHHSGTSDALETIPVSFSLLPVPEPGHKHAQACTSLAEKSCSAPEPSVSISGLEAPGLPTVFGALADVVQQAEELEKNNTVVEPDWHADWEMGSPLSSRDEGSVQPGAQQQLSPELQRATSADTVSASPGCHPHSSMELIHSQQWPQCPGQDQEIHAGDAGLMQPSLTSHSDVMDRRILDDCEDFCPVIKTEPMSPKAEPPSYLVEQDDLLSQSLESHTTQMTVTAASTNEQLIPDEKKCNTSARLGLSDVTQIHQNLSTTIDASVVSSVFPLPSVTEASCEGSETGGTVHSNIIDLTNIKEEPCSDDDDLQELFVSFASEAQQVVDSGSKTTPSITTSSGTMRNDSQVKTAEDRTVPRLVSGSVQGSSFQGSARPLNRPLSRALGRPPSRLPHRFGTWRNHMQPLQQALKVVRKMPTFSSQRGRLPARVGKSSVCGICSGEIASHQDFVHHMRMHNKGELGHMCPVCLKTFKSRTQITHRHSAIHGLRDLYTCPICSIQITRRDSFKRHFTLTHPNDLHVLHRYLQSYITARKTGLPSSRAISSSGVPVTAQPRNLPQSSTSSTSVDVTSVHQRQGIRPCWSSSAPAPTQLTDSSASTSSSTQSLQRRLMLGVPYNASTVTSSEHSFPGHGVICCYCGQSLQNLSQLLHHGDIHGPQAGTSSQAYSAPYTCPICRQMVESLQQLEMHISDRHNLPSHPGTGTIPRNGRFPSSSSSGGCSAKGGNSRGLVSPEGSSQNLVHDLNYLGPGRSVQNRVAGGSGPSQDGRIKENRRQEMISQPISSSSGPAFAKPLPPSSMPPVSIPPMPRLHHRPSAQMAPRAPGLPALQNMEPGSQYRDSGLQASGLGHSALSAPSKQGVHPLSLQGTPPTSTAAASTLAGGSYGTNAALSDSAPGSLGASTEAVSSGSACTFCGTVITTTEEFMLHVEMHGCLSPRIICPICRQLFCRKAILVRHSTSHMTGKWVCRFCKKSFARSDSCKRHLRSRHSQLSGSLSQSWM